MIKPELLQAFPTKRIKAIDGMSVTADVWEDAHAYHRQQQRFHALFGHGPGIVTGLEVMASDPPDTSVYILPGMAVDSHGQTVFLTEPLSYDVGTRMDGQLYLLLIHSESNPLPARVETPRRDVSEGGPMYVHTEFVLQAIPALPDTPHVELARVKRVGKDSALRDAKAPRRPGVNEIDLRYRLHAGAATRGVVSIGVAYAGGMPVAEHGRGAGQLAAGLSHDEGRQVCVDDHIPLAPGLEGYTLVYLVASSAFQLGADEVNALHVYLQSGGTIFMEACRRSSPGASPADASLTALAASLGVQLEDVKPGHGLLGDPHLFSTVPPGFETEGAPGLKAGGGVVMGLGDYGCAWQGDRRRGPASREEIRSAHEWGGNLVEYACQRRRSAKASAR